MAGMKVVPVGTAHDGSVNMEDLFKKVVFRKAVSFGASKLRKFV